MVYSHRRGRVWLAHGGSFDVSAAPYDSKRPQIRFYKHMVQLIEEKRHPVPTKRDRPERFDYEYLRDDSRNLYLFFQPFAG